MIMIFSKHSHHESSFSLLFFKVELPDTVT
jgi:hypothetical protein